MTDWRARAREIALEEGVHPDLFERLVSAESGFNVKAVSKAGARGPAQLMPGTARDLGVNIDDPEQNLRGGARYLRQQIDRFKSTPMALAAYNAGPGRVSRSGGIPRIAETENYVRKINAEDDDSDIFGAPLAAAPVEAPSQPSIRQGEDGVIEIDINEGRGAPEATDPVFGDDADIFAPMGPAPTSQPAMIPEPKEPYNKGVFGEIAASFGGAKDRLAQSMADGRAQDDKVVKQGVVKSILDLPRSSLKRAGRELSMVGDVAGMAFSPIDGVTKALAIKPAVQALEKVLPRARTQPKLAEVVAEFQGKPFVSRELSEGENRDLLEQGIGSALGAAMPIKGAKGLPAMPVRSDRRVASALERAAVRDQTTLGEVAAKARATPEVPAFQSGGENMLGLTEVVAQSPGRGSSILTKAVRDDKAAAADRVKTNIAEGLGGQGDYFATIDKKVAERAERAEPVRKRAFAQPVDGKRFDEEIAPLLPRIPGKAFGYAMEIAKRDGVNPNDLGIVMPTGPGKPRTIYEDRIVTERGSLGEPIERTRSVPVREEIEPEAYSVSRPTMRTLHYIKKGIDQELESYRNQVTGKLDVGNGLGAATAKLRSEYGRALRGVNPDYDEFMQLWGDDSGHLSSLELGRDVLSRKFDMSAERLTERVGGMNDVEQDFFRKGVGEAVIDQARNKGGVNAMRQLLKSEEFGDRIKLAFPTEANFKKFMDAAETEVLREAGNNRVINNSRTFGRAAAAEDLKDAELDGADVASAAADIFSLNLPSMGAKAFKSALKNLPRKDRSILGDPVTNEVIGRALADPDEMTRLLNVLEAVKARRSAPLSRKLEDLAPKVVPALSVGGQTTGSRQK